jgi:hypothetical protein
MGAGIENAKHYRLHSKRRIKRICTMVVRNCQALTSPKGLAWVDRNGEKGEVYGKNARNGGKII